MAISTDVFIKIDNHTTRLTFALDSGYSLKSVCWSITTKGLEEDKEKTPTEEDG